MVSVRVAFDTQNAALVALTTHEDCAEGQGFLG